MVFFEPLKTDKPDTVRFAAKDGEVVLGTCDMVLHDQLADLVSVQLETDDLSIGEGLLRAALNYAANRGYYIAACSAPDADAVRSLLPFKLKNEMWQNDIPTLLRGSCGKN